MDPHHTWIFSTDADTVVPQDWVVNTLTIATATGADLVAGLADLDDWAAPAAARTAYAELIESGIVSNGRHSHIYAANLAVRADRFLQVGGFPDRLHGEEHGLLDAVQQLRGTHGPNHRVPGPHLRPNARTRRTRPRRTARPACRAQPGAYGLRAAGRPEP